MQCSHKHNEHCTQALKTQCALFAIHRDTFIAAQICVCVQYCRAVQMVNTDTFIEAQLRVCVLSVLPCVSWSPAFPCIGAIWESQDVACREVLGILVCKSTCRVLSSFLSRQTYMSRAIREEICSGMIKTITNVILHAAHTDLAPHGWCARVFDNEIPLLGSFKHNRGLNITFLFNLFKQKFSLQFCSLEFMCFVTYLHFCLLACRPTFE